MRTWNFRFIKECNGNQLVAPAPREGQPELYVLKLEAKSLPCMKTKIILTSMLFLLSFTALADDSKTKDNKTVPPKPYPLKTCLVCGMTLGDMGKPFVFEYKGQEIKVCDKPEKIRV